MICGLSCPLNFEERETSDNRSKSNRFLPWRVVKDEIGSVPVNRGDFCQFLDPDTEEWVLETFLGDWWFNKTKHLFGAGNASISRTDQLREEWKVKYENLLRERPNFYEERTALLRERGFYRDVTGKVLQKYLVENPEHQSYAFSKILEKNPNHQSEAGSLGGAARASQESFKEMSKSNLVGMNNTFWEDPDHPELGQHRSGLLVRKQKKLGYPHGKENRVRVS
jgi:hypothetical protein